MKYILPIAAVVLTMCFVSIPLVWSDGSFQRNEHDDYEDHGEYKYKKLERRFTGVAMLENPLYIEECGSCHMAYPAGLLPAVSWEKIMQGLDEHFGDNAELDEESNQQITNFLQKNSSDNAHYRRSKQFTDESSMQNAQIRITASRYFMHEHDDIPDRLVSGNQQVKSFSHCNACHLKAEQSMFNEHDIKIPRYGGWDD